MNRKQTWKQSVRRWINFNKFNRGTSKEIEQVARKLNKALNFELYSIYRMKITARHYALYETKITNCTHLMKLSVILIYFPEGNNRVFKNYLLWLWEIILPLRIGGDLFKKVTEKFYLSMIFKVEFFFLLRHVVFITRNKSLRETMGRRWILMTTARFKKRISSWKSCSRSILRSIFLTDLHRSEDVESQ